MKRILLYVGALLLLFQGGRGRDIGSLRPVELVQLTERNGVLILETDTGDRGWGLTVEEAVAKLKQTTPGWIYLDTASFLLIEEGVEQYLPAIQPYLKRETMMAYAAESVDLTWAAEYLRIHKPSQTIGKCEKPQEKLILEGEKINLKIF